MTAVGRIWTREDPVWAILREHAVHMLDGSGLEVCLFCTSTHSTGKVVFEDRVAVDMAAAELELLPAARGLVRVHRCRMWRGIWHLTSMPWGKRR